MRSVKSRPRGYRNLVKAGEQIVIHHRNLPVAKLPPFSPQEASEEELLLVATGKMRLPKSALKVEELLKIPTGRLAGSEGTQALREERDKGL